MQNVRTTARNSKTPRNLSKRVRKKEDSPAEQAVNQSEIISTRDENSVFGEYVANKLRKRNKPKVEVSQTQRYINDILFSLDMGLLAAEIPSIHTQHPPSISVSSTPFIHHHHTFHKTVIDQILLHVVQKEQEMFNFSNNLSQVIK